MSDNPGIYAAFSLEPVEQSFKSKEAGRPIFEDREFVRIIIAGDKNTEVYREATEADKERFHEPYARFKRGLDEREQIVGTPLSQWTLLKPSQVRELEAIKIYSVEQLAALSDTMKQNLGMGAHELVAAARAFLESARNNSVASSLAAENERLRNDVERLQQQVQALADRLEDSERGNERRSPGRPPKAARETTLEL
ncbi:hypothetical protein FHT70_005268 [Rhizobium sp. BK049]|uniref:hypothetical protein n=1 Tax=Rhizobium sp. BK049 TaxID=2587095 RepID=UPI0016151D60|nr:hypothetical protein [Rhizobium sp. BK049]MBB3355307.1 hypothetical protein [Rhizobium sp. BK049]